RFVADSGTRATRRSPAVVSLGTTIRIQPLSATRRTHGSSIGRSGNFIAEGPSSGLVLAALEEPTGAAAREREDAHRFLAVGELHGDGEGLVFQRAGVRRGYAPLRVAFARRS